MTTELAGSDLILNGTWQSRAEAKVSVNGGQVTTIVAFGADDGLSLLGAYTLEGLTLIVDPSGKRLVPQDLLTL